MAKDYYKTLGVEKNASGDDVKKAFRKLAHEYHPDKKGGNADKFKEVSEAYSVLSDEKKRKQYDTFGSAGPTGAGGFGGQQGFNPNDFGFDFSGFQQGGFGQNGGVEFDLNDLFGSIFGGGRARQRRGRDVQVDIHLSLHDAVFGTEREISYKKNLKVTIPAGINDGEMLKLASQGEPVEGGVPGDLYVRIHIEPHKFWHKDGANIVGTLNVKLSDALLGAEYPLETLDGSITLKIPEGVAHDEILRIRGKGVPQGRHRGDALVRVHVVLPRKLSRDAKKKIEELKKEGI